MDSIQRFRIWYAAQPRALRALVAANVVIYLLWQVVFIHIEPARTFVWNHLALNPGIPGILYEPWQLITYAFLHLQPGFGGLLHVGFNMLWLWWIGKDLEELQGPHTMLALYVYCGVGGALLTVMLLGAFPGSALFNGIVHGASGSVLGVMAATAVLYPFKSIGLMFIGAVKIRHLVIGLLALDILFLAAGGTSITAHFGGAATGLAFARLQQMGTDTTGWARWFFRGGPQGRSSSGPLDRMESWLSRRGKAGRPAEQEPVKARIIRMDGSSRRAAAETKEQSPDIDKILDKISERGYDSLTPEEKKILYEASGK